MQKGKLDIASNFLACVTITVIGDHPHGQEIGNASQEVEIFYCAITIIIKRLYLEVKLSQAGQLTNLLHKNIVLNC